MPPDGVGILDGKAPRFIYAGRFIAAARQLEVPVRVGTTAGDTGESQWPAMRDGGFVSIGWSEQVPDLSETIGQDKAKERIREWLLAGNPTNPGVASRKAREILKFAQEIAENDWCWLAKGKTCSVWGEFADLTSTMVISHFLTSVASNGRCLGDGCCRSRKAEC
jgi:5-methylcytosine-specific restriction protein B